jgi:hypothetical protein
MADGIQLPAGYEDAKPVAGTTAAQPQGVSLPAGFEDAKPVAGTQQTPPQSMAVRALNQIGETGADVASGFVKGAGDTVSGVSHLINKIPGVGETLAPKAGVTALDKLDVTDGTGEAAGKGLEGIAEYAAGDELLSGLSDGVKLVALAKKYPLINEVMAMAKDHPLLAKIIAGGAKGAAVGTVEGGVKGAQKGQTGKGALEGGTLGAVTGAATAAIPTVTTALKNPYRKAVRALTDTHVQPELQSGLRDVWNTVADNAGVARPTTQSIQDAGQEVGDNILARSKRTYADIDKATEGRFSGTEQALKSVNQDLRSVTNDTEEANLLTRKTRLELQMNQMMDDAALSGVDASDVAKAKSDFKQAQAIYDTNHQVRMSTTGVRPGQAGAAEVPEEVNPKSLMNRLNKLYNKGRLVQAVGTDSAEDMIGHSAIAQKAAKDVASKRKVAAIVVPATAATAAEAYHAFRP